MSGRLIVNFVSRIVSRVGSIGVNVIFIGVAARTLSVANFGQFMFLLTMIGVFVQLADFGTTTALSKLVNDRDLPLASTWSVFLAERFKLSLIATVAAAVVIQVIFDGPTGWVVIAALTVPFAASRFFEPLFQRINDPWSIAWLTGLYCVALIIGVAIAKWLTFDAGGFLSAYLLANVLYLIVAYALAGRRISRSPKREAAVRTALWAIAWPTGWGGVFTTINSRANVLIVEAYASHSEVAIFTGGVRVLDMMIAVAMTILTPLMPLFCEGASRKRRLMFRYQNVLLSAFTIFVLIMLSSEFWSGPLAVLLYGSAYAHMAPTIAVFTGVGALASVCMLNSMVLMALDKTRFAIPLTACAAATNVLASVCLVSRYGFFSAAWVALVVEAAMCAYTFLLIKRHLGAIVSPRMLARLAIAAAGLTIAFVSAHYALTDQLQHHAFAAVAGLLYLALARRCGLLGLSWR